MVAIMSGYIYIYIAVSNMLVIMCGYNCSIALTEVRRCSVICGSYDCPKGGDRAQLYISAARGACTGECHLIVQLFPRNAATGLGPRPADHFICPGSF